MNASSDKIVRVGARGSKLSQAQADIVLQKLRESAPDHQFEFKVISTTGDVNQRAPLSSMGGRGAFAKELESALLRGEIDLAVHSAKDLPSRLPEGLVLAGVPERAAVEDALISLNGLSLKELLPGAKLATGSPRRRALVMMFRPDLKVIDIRGNVDTRLRRLRESEFDAIILSLAGLARLGLDYHVTQVLPPREFIPAPGQGAIALEVRADDGRTMDMASLINSAPDHAVLMAERSFLSELGAGCSIPVGTWGRWEDGILKLDAAVIEARGRKIYRTSGEINRVEEAEDLGKRLAENLIAQGAGELLSDGR